jgi:hypothetical protein
MMQDKESAITLYLDPNVFDEVQCVAVESVFGPCSPQASMVMELYCANGTVYVAQQNWCENYLDSFPISPTPDEVSALHVNATLYLMTQALIGPDGQAFGIQMARLAAYWDGKAPLPVAWANFLKAPDHALSRRCRQDLSECEDVPPETYLAGGVTRAAWAVIAEDLYAIESVIRIAAQHLPEPTGLQSEYFNWIEKQGVVTSSTQGQI